MVSQRYSGLAYQRHCLTAPLPSSIMFGGAFSAMHIFQGAQPSPALFARNIGFIYVYHALQCPMEGVHGRRSLAHNGLAAGGMGFWAVSAGQASVPFLDGSFFYKYPAVKPPVAAFAVYGLIGMIAGSLGGKQL